jgi:hypothetical protein
VDDLPITATVAALDQALARIAVELVGSQLRATELLSKVGRGETDAFTAAFLSQAAALLRARLLLADAARRPTSLRKRQVA